MLKKIIVREALLDDARLIADLTRKAWAGKCPPTARGHRDTWVNVSEDLHKGGAFILLIDGTPAGSLRWAPVDELAPEIEFSTRDTLDPPPLMMRKTLYD